MFEDSIKAGARLDLFNSVLDRCELICPDDSLDRESIASPSGTRSGFGSGILNLIRVVKLK